MTTTQVRPPVPASGESSVTRLLIAANLLEDAPPVGVRMIFRRFWPDTRSFRGRIWLSLVFVALAPALSAVTIYLFKILVDDVLIPHDYRLFFVVAGIYLLVSFAEGIVSFYDQYLSTWVGERFVLNLRRRLFAHLHRLSSEFFERRQLGDVLSRLTGDVAAIEQLVLSGVSEALTYGFQLLFFTAALFYLNWQLALASLIAAPAFLLVARSFSRRIKDAAREKRRRAGSITTVAEESFGNAALVRAYDRQAAEEARFDRENTGSFTAQMRATRLQSMFGPITEILEVVGVLLVMALAVYELAQNRITIGGLLVFVAYLTQLYGPIQSLGQLTNTIFAASASAERVIEILDTESAVAEPANPVRLGRASGLVEIHGVGFRYPSTTAPALSDVDLTVRPGQKVAIVGASGAGKSTLAKLLLRFYDPTSGSITLDGCDLRELRSEDLRRNVATVLQETLVFDGTVRENILWGRPDATEEEIVAAARAADADAYIRGLPEGYDTRIGQRGRLLSGGQRQRLAIARAMIRDAPVLLLDEPTTGLDAESTRRVMEPLTRLMSGRTTIVISHNLLTVTDADRILFLEDGRVSAAGTHSHLLAASPGYAQLYRLHESPTGASASAGETEPPEPSSPEPERRPTVPTTPADAADPVVDAAAARPTPAPRRRLTIVRRRGLALAAVATTAVLGLLLVLFPQQWTGGTAVSADQALATWINSETDVATAVDAPPDVRAELIRNGVAAQRLAAGGALVVTQGQAAAGEPVVRFGDGDGALTVSRPASAPVTTGPELAARAAAGGQLVANPNVVASPAARDDLQAGRVDPRALAVLAGLAGRGPIRIDFFPATPGEDPALPRHRVELAGLDAAALGWIRAQQAPFAAATATTGATTVLSWAVPIPAELLGR
ncbi:hypothetical protein GCM10009836_03450 [Pseudonocardia ailaonensis]|uniref:ABC transporter n=1 Tax=Pseudonocardia ailaonensis TaxID=367279 RepID=A0ABN2MJB9_9PSEU